MEAGDSRGAGAMRPDHGDADHEQRARKGLHDALAAGGAVLSAGGSGVDAVEVAVRVLEDDPCFNAGRGSTLNAQGLVELDAAIMDGATRRAGAVAGVRTTRAPISLARGSWKGDRTFSCPTKALTVSLARRGSSRSTMDGS